MMLLINFGHPLTEIQRRQIVSESGQEIEREISLKVQFDPLTSFTDQARTLVDQTGLSSQEWQTLRLLINPPTLHLIAVIVLAELHGRMGYFPPVLRLRQVPGALPPEFAVAEIVNLQTVRDLARAQR